MREDNRSVVPDAEGLRGRQCRLGRRRHVERVPFAGGANNEHLKSNGATERQVRPGVAGRTRSRPQWRLCPLRQLLSAKSSAEFGKLSPAGIAAPGWLDRLFNVRRAITQEPSCSTSLSL
jgi:hypothetical protein